MRVIDGGYDYLLTVESDMIIPPDTLTRLMALDAGVAYGLYVHRHTRHNWSAYTSLKSKEGHSLSVDPDAARSAWGTVMDVAGVGLGCTLISKNTLKRIPFRLFSDAPDKTACDWAFAFDCAIQGISQRCDLGVVCGHQSYTPYPMIIWPDPNEPNLYRRESLPGVEMKEIKPGDQFHIGMGEMVLAKAKDDDTASDPVELVKTKRPKASRSAPVAAGG